ncbi:hypothetical protein J4E86_003692 [Alternaria arbusti]|uniref:uncharacterized protein n=1 Tax=Alternaria arbusti TaxID=232088 RepID=UPI0022204FDD|nr:uncharacterized protein J4E86_003692 [Alternaria arbusti]KAI4958096.1 hypothetical protein J4E86_003692 [Alternaria arbusti]
MSSKYPNTNPASSPTAQKGQKANDASVGDLSERLTDVKIGISKNVAMEDLTKDLASKWEPDDRNS